MGTASLWIGSGWEGKNCPWGPGGTLHCKETSFVTNLTSKATSPQSPVFARACLPQVTHRPATHP